MCNCTIVHASYYTCYKHGISLFPPSSFTLWTQSLGTSSSSSLFDQQQNSSFDPPPTSLTSSAYLPICREHTTSDWKAIAACRLCANKFWNTRSGQSCLCYVTDVTRPQPLSFPIL